jgi:hypothetical protein
VRRCLPLDNVINCVIMNPLESRHLILPLSCTLPYLGSSRDGSRDLSGGDRDFAAMGQADYGQVRGKEREKQTHREARGRVLCAAPLCLSLSLSLSRIISNRCFLYYIELTVLSSLSYSPPLHSMSQGQRSFEDMIKTGHNTASAVKKCV